MKYNIWAEGFLVQGMEGIPEKASFVGQSEGSTFAEACENWYKKNVSPCDFKRFFHIDHEGNPIYWVRLFNNEEDTRKAFG